MAAQSLVAVNLPGVAHQLVFDRSCFHDALLALAGESRSHRRHQLLVVLGSLQRRLEVETIARGDGLRVALFVGCAGQDLSLSIQIG